MKKTRGCVITLCILLAIVLFITFIIGIIVICKRKAFYKNCPSRQEISQWMSEDSDIFFKTEQNGYAYGYIKIDNEVIPVQFTFDPVSPIYINGYTSTGSTIMHEYDKWQCSYYSKNSFTAEIVDSVFFKSGEKIKFHKLKDEEQIDYEPLSFQSKEDNIKYENTIDKNADLLIPIINESVLGNDVQYESHMIALRMNFSKIREITNAEIISIENGFMNLHITDGDENDYVVVYSLSERKVHYIYEDSVDGQLIYSINDSD